MNQENLQQMEVDFQFDPRAEQLLNADEMLAVYRVLQEQSNNINRYANATRVMICIAVFEQELHMDISDNAKGFEIESVDIRKGFGLFNMQNRARAQNGNMIINS